MDALAARLSIVAGPDSGKEFGLTNDLAHIGRGADNDIELSDPHLADHEATIASRNGRFAIYVPLERQVEVDGSVVPAERWVWLPMTARIRFGMTTECDFSTVPLPGAIADGNEANVSTVTLPMAEPREPAEASGEDGTAPPRPTTASVKTPPKLPTGRRRKVVRKADVARFITDQPGDPLVRLGEDGKLPELALADATDRKKSDRPEERNPLVLYGALTCSFVMSIGMLLIDDSPTGTTSRERDGARQQLEQFFGEAGSELEPYQIALRQARIEYSQGDYSDERVEYRRVLNMLNAADVRSHPQGLTGRATRRGKASDEELRAALETLLGD
ncbi:MAG: FHA domain-containing protein [Planctomycetaceae bacterium]